MKRIKRLKTAGIFISAVGTLLLIAAVVMQLLRSRGGYTGNIVYGSEEFETPRELVVITTSMPITVGYGETDKAEVSYTGSLPLIFSEKKGTLSITQDDSFTLTLFSAEAAKQGVNITLPHKMYERISLSSSSGSVESDSLAAGTLEFSTKSGDMRLYGIDERASVRTESGNIYAEFSSFSSDMNINAGAGDVTLVLPENLSLYLEFFTGSGRFTSDYFDKYYNARYGDAAIIYNGAENKLNVTTTSGDLIVTK